MPHGITQCYLPPGTAGIPALTPAEAGTRLSDPGGMQGKAKEVILIVVNRKCSAPHGCLVQSKDRKSEEQLAQLDTGKRVCQTNFCLHL